MTAAQFKKDSKVTYVLVKGEPRGIVVPASAFKYVSLFALVTVTAFAHIFLS